MQDDSLHPDNKDLLRLILLRHAEALPMPDGEQDWNRPLSPKGIEEARQVGKRLKGLSWKLDKIFISDALRTRQTWEAINQFLQIPPDQVEFIPDLYCASLGELKNFLQTRLEKLENLNQGHQFMIIGHNPGLEEFANYLGQRNYPSPIKMGTASLVCLKTSSSLGSSSGSRFLVRGGFSEIEFTYGLIH